MVKEIIESLADGKLPIADVLRRTLVLSYRINHEPLRKWVEQELNGYANAAELPNYRRSQGVAKGLLLGPLGAQLPNQPLASGILKEEHQHWAREIRLTQPIASYEIKDHDDAGHWAIEWPADLVVRYQEKFIEGWALNRAYMEIPISMIVALIDTVRTRLLTFMLEIEAAAETQGENGIQLLPPTTVDQIMHVTIMGGNNVFGSVNQFNAATVVAGDKSSLKEQLQTLGLGQDELESLDNALQEDGLSDVSKAEPKSPGEKTLEWIGRAAKATGKKGLDVGGAVVQEAIKRAVFGYLGF